MKAIVLEAARRLAVTDIPPPPAPGPGEIRLGVTAVGICGSDVHYFAAGRIGSQVVRYPFRVGHEFAARVIAAGANVTGFRPGDPVTVDPAISCESCDQCRAGRAHTCRNLRFLGCPGQAEGCLCEQILMPARCVFKIPAQLDPASAALIEPLAIGCYTARLAGAQVRERVGILGCGPIGLSALAAFRDAGAQTIRMTDPLAYRCDAARALGADWVGPPEAWTASGDDPETALDCVAECCGQPEALDQAVRALRPGGRLLLVGIPREPRISLDIDILRRRELTLQNVRRQNECVPAALRLLERRLPALRALITHRGPPEQAQRLFEMVDSYRDGVIKAVIDFETTRSAAATRRTDP